jgi:hypothetical protein
MRGLVRQNRALSARKEEHGMSDETRPEEEVEAHGPVGLEGPGLEGPGLEGPGLEGPAASSDEEPDVEAHGPVGLEGPGLEGPGLEGPGLE